MIRILSQEEITKAYSFHYSKDKYKYIITHVVLRVLLSKYYPEIKPSCWEFKYNQYGKPFISEKHQIKLFFNLSHTQTSFAIIINKSGVCGIDIEGNSGSNFAAIDMILSKNEKKVLSIKKISFYTFWTLKEAYLKAVGIGLTISPLNIFFNLINYENGKPFIKKNFQMASYHIVENDTYISYAIPKQKTQIIISIFTLNHLERKIA